MVAPNDPRIKVHTRKLGQAQIRMKSAIDRYVHAIHSSDREYRAKMKEQLHASIDELDAALTQAEDYIIESLKGSPPAVSDKSTGGPPN